MLYMYLADNYTGEYNDPCALIGREVRHLAL